MDVRARDGVAAAGDATVLRPRLDAPANALALPPPSPAKLGIRQLGTATRLSADPCERRFIVEGAERYDNVWVCSIVGHVQFPWDVHLLVGYTAGLIRRRI